jgi:hypothetical protein
VRGCGVRGRGVRGRGVRGCGEGLWREELRCEGL